MVEVSESLGSRKRLEGPSSGVKESQRDEIVELGLMLERVMHEV